MDFHVKTGKGEQIIIEMQAKRHVMFDERAVFYIAIQILDFDTELAKGIVSPDNAACCDTLIKRKKDHNMKEKQYLKDHVLTDKISGQMIDIIP